MSYAPKYLKHGAAALGGLGLVGAAISNLEVIAGLRYTAFWPLLIVSWILIVVAIWPEPARANVGFHPSGSSSATRATKLFRLRWVIILTLLFTMAGIWRYWKVTHPESLPPGPIIDDTVPMSVSAARASYFFAGLSLPVQPQIRAEPVQLSTLKTSYVESGKSGVPYFRLPGRFADSYTDPDPDGERWSGCIRYRMSTALAAALRRFVVQKGRTSTLQYFSNAASLDRLVRQRAAVLREIIPRGDEWREIQSPSDKRVIQDWLRECVGLPRPVLSVALTNVGRTPVTVSAVRYTVVGWEGLECGGGEDGMWAQEAVVPPPLITATAIYPQRLLPYDQTPRRTRQRVMLRPNPFGLGPNQQETLELFLYSTNRVLFPLRMRVELETSVGTIRLTEFWIDFAADHSC